MTEPQASQAQSWVSTLARYSVAAMLAAVALVLRLLLSPMLAEASPFIVFTPAILAASALAGTGPALLALLIGAAGGGFLILHPHESVTLTELRSLLQLALFVGSGLLIVAVAHVARTASQVARVSSAALEQVQQQFRLVAESVRDVAIFLLDQDGRIVTWNAGAQRMFGYSGDEIIGQNVRIVHTPEQIKERHSEALLRQAAEQGSALEQSQRVRKDGSLLWVDLTQSALHDSHGKLMGFLKITRDISGQRLAEEAREQLVQQLRHERARLEAVLTQMPAGVIIAEAPSGKFILANDRVSEILQQPDLGVEVIEQYARFTGFRPDGSAVEPQQWPLVRALTQGETVRDEEYDLQRPDGSRVTLNINAAPIRDSAGQVIAAVVIFIDITDRKKAEQHVRHVNENLERLVAERTAELSEANQNLEEFAYSVSHDLRAPLRSIDTYARQLLERDSVAPDEAAVEQVGRIVAGCLRMDALIHDLLEYSRITRAEVQLEPLSLVLVVNSVVGALGQQGERHPRIVVQEPLPWVTAHRATLIQIITNLITNAIKFVPPDVQPTVRIWSERVDGFTRMWVEDNGIGIPAEDQRQIFEPFMRLHAESEFPGTGIGLAIVRKGIERMGGRVGVESELGRGSRFWIDLPPAAASPAAREQRDE
jgi:PAS domain S-box-containing protein